jgi:hypothetical protein
MRLLNFAIAFANRKASALLRLGIQSRNLIERHPQARVWLATASPSCGGQVTVLDINRHAENVDISSLYFWQEFGFQNIFAVALLVQIHRQIKMKIDDPALVKPVDSFLDRLVHMIASRKKPRITRMSLIQISGDSMWRRLPRRTPVVDCRAFELLAPAICTLRASRLCRSAPDGSALWNACA